VRCRDEQNGVARGAALADEVGADDRLAVAGPKRVQRSEREGDRHGAGDERDAELVTRDE
jgi:hypothetical protein